MKCLRGVERDVKLVAIFTSLEPIRYMIDQHILMVFKDILEELHILEIEEENVRRQTETGKGSRKETRMCSVPEVKRGEWLAEKFAA